jgi:DNA polymerase-1
VKEHLKAVSVPYQHYFQAAPPDPRFPDAFNFLLVSDEDSFQEMCARALVLSKKDRLILAADPETTGLNHETEKIVGVSLCFEEETAYYLPLAHRVGRNLADPLRPYLCELLYRARVVPLFNARFDLRFFRTIGADISKIKYYDVAVPLWFTDTNVRRPGLKKGALHFLGWDMTTYEEAVGDQADLSFCLPEEASPYACSDALSTWHLARRLEFIRRKHSFTVDLDNRILLPVMVMEETPTPIDLEVVTKTRQEAITRMEELEHEIHSSLGRVFKINAGQQLGTILAEHGLDTGERTEKTKQMKTGADELKAIQDQHPIIPKIIEYKTLHKFLTSYCNNFLKEYDEAIGGIRFAYQTTTTPTGRLAASGDKKNSFFAGSLNVQAIDKANQMLYRAVPCDYDSVEPNCFLGWRFIPKSECPEEYEGPWVEGFDPKLNIRRSFGAYPGHLWVHFDYMAQELRIPANLSKEPVWVEAFKKLEDLHWKIAALIWGEEAATLKRKYEKALNFGALYGGSKYTFARQLGCSPEDAQKILDEWWAALKTLARWVKTSENRAKKNGYIETFFGRPRRVKHYFSQTKWSMQSFAKRTAINTQVQGAGADVMKIGMCKVYDHILSHPGNKGRVKLLSCIHDELNFSITRKEPYFTTACCEIQDLMEIEIPGWEVPMLVDCAVGDSWGNMFPMRYNRETDTWEPTYA